MCPACIASATLIAGGAVTTGGVTALVGKVLHSRKIAQGPGIPAIQTKGEMIMATTMSKTATSKSGTPS